MSLEQKLKEYRGNIQSFVLSQGDVDPQESYAILRNAGMIWWHRVSSLSEAQGCRLLSAMREFGTTKDKKRKRGRK